MKTWQKLKNNPSLWQKHFLREKIIKAIRSFFDNRGFHEVEAPLLIAHPPAESYLEVFKTELLNRKREPTPMYLSTSPETSLKKLLVAGIGNCYSVTKSFRNTEVADRLHNPEFTILEWYRVGATYKDMMTDCEQLFLHLLSPKTKPLNQDFALNVGKLLYQGNLINLSLPWKRISMRRAFRKYAGVDLDTFFDIENARKIAASRDYFVSNKHTWEELFNQVFLNEVEPNLPANQPVFLYDFPSAMGALAKKRRSDPRFAERFELYIGGLEIADCYTELTDWKEQKSRFDREMKKIKKLGKTSYEYDRDFIEALKIGLPDCAGVALGIDRLLMLFLDVGTIADTMLFPTIEMVRQ